MQLFVDETENESFFIVGGILVDSRESASATYKRFKRRIKEYPITNNERMKNGNDRVLIPVITNIL